jgi:hypothetical protein
MDCKECMSFFVTCPCGCGVSFCPSCMSEEDDGGEEE